ncbi:MAG: hypothetical protein ACYDDI_12910 [Candidatus Acidiferrales bacterium]
MPNKLSWNFLIAAAVLALVACIVPLRAQYGDRLTSFKVKAPDFPKPGFAVSGTTWLNSPPLTLDLIPTVSRIMIDSFTFGNSCQTQFPHV